LPLVLCSAALSWSACNCNGESIGKLVPKGDFNPKQIDFGDVTVGTTSMQTATLENTGSIPFMVSSADVPPQFQLGDKMTMVVGLDLVAGSKQDLTVSFTPSAEGEQTGTFVVHVEDNVTINLDVRGNGVTEKLPQITLSPMSIDFGTVMLQQTVRRSITFSNAGPGDGSVDQAVLGSTHNPPSMSDVFTLGTSVSYAVPAGGSTKVDVLFTPVVGGMFMDTIVFTGKIGMTPQLVLNVKGKGQAQQGNLSCMPGSIDFGTQPRGMVQTQQVTCTAHGGLVQIQSASLSGDPMFSLPMPPGMSTLSDGQSMMFNVQFNPQGSAMVSAMGTCTVNYSGTMGNGNIMIPLSGAVQEPPPTTQAIALVLTADDLIADIDIHLVRPGGTPFDPFGGSDCFYENCTPLPYTVSWPSPTGNDPSYDPHLDRDPVFMVGDEHINLQNAEAGAYDAYVHYFGTTRTAGNDSHSATVQVYVAGHQVGTYNQTLTCNQLWHVGTINWTGMNGTFAPDTSTTMRSEGCCGMPSCGP
jgi:hypothetical protein